MHIHTHARRMPAIAIVAGSLITSCGMQGDDPLSKAEFVDQANAICEATNVQLDPLFDAIYAEPENGSWDDPANQLLLFARWDEAMIEAAPIIDGQLDDLGDLDAPSEDAEFVDTLIADQAAAVEEFATLVAAAADGDTDALALLDSDAEDPFDDVNRRAREYGLTVCGEDG